MYGFSITLFVAILQLDVNKNIYIYFSKMKSDVYYQLWVSNLFRKIRNYYDLLKKKQKKLISNTKYT